MCKAAELLRALAPYAGVAVAILVALFLDDYKRWRTRPKLGAETSSCSPHCVKNTHLCVGGSSVERPHYSLRIAIENCGNSEAKNVEVFAKELKRQKGRGTFEPVTDFLGTYLRWSGAEDGERVVLDVLNPEMPKYCYLARVFWKENLPTSWYSDVASPTEDYLGDRTFLEFPPPLGSGRRQRFGPGNYRLTVRIGAANAKPIEKVLNIHVTGRWPGVESENVSEVLEFGTHSS